jgi:hypothetical protein
MFVTEQCSSTDSGDSSVRVVAVIHAGRLMSSPWNGRFVKIYI